MEEVEIKLGDVVIARCGGPKLTVSGIDEDGNYICRWFDKSKLKSVIFPPECIAIDQAPPGLAR